VELVVAELVVGLAVAKLVVVVLGVVKRVW
jgi:hypothetical protein